ncbi:MAG: hypothetical protein QQN63_04185 [Nitrosopumilus sp.]
MPLRGRQLIIDYHQRLGDEVGDRIMKDLRKSAHFDAPLTSGNPTTLALEAGAANIIKHIYKMLRKDPNALTEKTAISITSEPGE